MSARRAAAIAALALQAAALVASVLVALHGFPRGLVTVACAAVAAGAAWYAILRRGPARSAGLVIALIAAVATAVLLVTGLTVAKVALVAALLLALAAARTAFAGHTSLPRAPAPRRPVLIYNPRSGGGKAERFALAEEARKRGIEPLELSGDLEAQVRGAVAGGADAVAMAGGDGSQAVVAAVAAELNLPYACIPAGTRNHFALDLGVDRDDVVGALDAFVDGGERIVDLAEVNGRVFVNNVSLGVYAEAVQREGYRDAKLRTLLDTAQDVMASDGKGPDLRWSEPDGDEHRSGAVILVSNNRYRLGRAVGSGTRPRLDEGRLGVAVADPPRWREWTAETFAIEAERPVPAGIDGEAAKLPSPLSFRIRPGALRVRIARRHPAASPSARLPQGPRDSLRALADIATHKSRRS